MDANDRTWSAWRSPRDGCQDFNGRLTRPFLAEILRRVDLPAVDPTPEAGQDTERYRKRSRPLTAAILVTVWRGRFEKEAEA